MVNAVVWQSSKWIILVLVVAACLRLVNLPSVPPSLYWEEAALGYDAYSLWKTGKDYHGNSWPVVAFESFGDYKPSGYFYLLAPFVGIFGLNEWTIRLPASIAGIISVYLVYLIGGELFKRKEIGLVSAFVLAVLPWHIQFSRAAFEVCVATMWMLVGLFLGLMAKKSHYLIVFAGLAFVASSYTYHGLRILAPLLALLVITLSPKLVKTVWFWIAGVVAVLIMLPLLLHISDKVITQRFQETSIFSISSAVTVTNALRVEHGNSWLSRVVYHRYWFWLGEVVTGMVKHFDPQFLFVRGDGNTRHQLPNMGLLYWWMSLPFLVSLIWLRKKTPRTPLLFLFGWIGLASIPPALSYPSPHTLRFLPASPAFSLLIGFGVVQLLSILSRLKIGLLFTILLTAVIFSEFISYAYRASTLYPAQTSRDWQYGYKEVVNFITTNTNENEKIFFTRAYGRPSIYYLLFTFQDPQTVQVESQFVPKDQSELLRYKNIDFISTSNTTYDWFINDQPLIDYKYNLHQIVNFLDGKPAFYIYKKLTKIK